MQIYTQANGEHTVFYAPFLSFFKAINHRGYNTIAPENTLPAYILSAKKGFKYVETDVSFTSDNVPVLLHDATIDRTSNGTGNISEMTFAEVRQYDFGSWKSADYAGTLIPSLEEFLILCRNLGLHPYIELKSAATYSAAQIQKIVDMVDSYGMKGDVSYISFSKAYLVYVKNYDSKARLGYVVSNVSSTKITDAIELRTGENEVFIDSGRLTAEDVDLCKADHIPMEVWTIDNKTTILNMSDYISGVTSNSVCADFIKYEQIIK